MTLYRIEAPFAVFGIIEDDSKIVKAAPICHWAVGKDLDYVTKYFDKKGYKIQIVGA